MHRGSIEFSTLGNGDLRDITAEANQIVLESGVQTGLAHFFNIGSTAAIGTIEFEPGLQRDLPELLNHLIPPSPNYGHEQTWHDGNGHSHLQATLMGPEITIPVQDGKLLLGTWQQVFHLECDNKPRQRTLAVSVFGD